MRSELNLRVAAYRAIGLLLVLLASAYLALNAGSGWAQEYEEASLNININQQGKELVYLRLDLESSPSGRIDQNILTDIVSEAVGCQLENVRIRGREGSWVLYGKCDGLSRQGWLVKTEVNPAPLVKFLRPLKVQELAIRIRHPRVGLSNSSSRENGDRLSQFYVEQSYNIPVKTTATPQLLHFEFGYSPSDIARIFALLGGFLLVPIGLILWMRQAALRAQKTDPAAVWFNYLRFLNLVVLGIWLVWFPVRFTSGVQNFIDFAFWGGAAWQKMAVNLSLSFLPPAIAIVFCYAISHPVFAKVRGVDWTRGDLMRQAAFSQCVTFLPLMLLIDGIAALGEDGRLGVACFAAAFVSRVLFARLSREAQNMTPHALTVGELRDRIFDLAQKAGVKLQQVYLLPAGKGQLANAFASSGNIIMLSDYLLQHLNKREVDAIVAHELGHLKHKHPTALGRILILAVILMLLLIGILTALLPWVPWSIVCGFLVIPAVYLFSRRFEYEADAEAVALSGDAEACISSLTKITRLNLMPMEWGKLNEKTITHPSTFKRAQAIANRGNISTEQLQQILTTPNDNGEHYAIPASVISEEKAFSTTFKTSVVFRIAWAQIAVKTITPAIYAMLVQYYAVTPHWTIYLGGLIVAIALSLILTNYASVWGYGKLQQQLRIKLEREGIKVDSLGGIFVGFAPENCPRVYENFFDWDVGFLFLAGDRLCYVGEQTRFVLQHEQVTDVHLGVGAPGWLPAPRIYITWSNEEAGTAGILNLHPAYVRSLLQHKREVRILNQKLQAWWEKKEGAIAIPLPLLQLNTPDIGAVTSISPRELTKFRQFLGNIYLLTLVGFGINIVLQLPLSAGCYVIFVAWIATLFQYIPYWRDRHIKLGKG